MKVCTKCKIEKEFIEFGKLTASKDGFGGKCRECVKNYYINNKEYKKEYQKQYRLDNLDKTKESSKKHYLNNKEQVKKNSRQYYADNKEYQKQYQKKYNLENKENRNKRERCKKLIDPLFKLKCNISNLIYMSAIKQGYSKKSRTYEILGCSYDEFKTHLENQFTKGMNWSNAGKWQLDHIYPVSLARDEQHLIKLNHYTNFQPLWAIDNLRKSNKITNNTQLS